jgi:ammonia channel protein AmtB
MSEFDLENTSVGLDKAWLLTCGAMIMSMQIGFAWLEAGGIRKKNSGIVYQKLTLNLMITIFSFWVIGYALAFGGAEDRFIGAFHFFAGNEWTHSELGHQTQYSHWMFQVSIAAVVPAITGGVVAERITLKATAIHTFFLSLLIYPFILSWTWGEGWMKSRCDYVDFTGSGIVHCTGAFAGLACLLVVGPRYQRWGDHEDVIEKPGRKSEYRLETEEGKALNSPNKAIPGNAIEGQLSEKRAILYHDEKRVEEEDGSRFTQANIDKMREKAMYDVWDQFGPSDMAVLLMGALFLWLGFIFFNAGSSLFMHSADAWLSAERAGVNTFMAGCGGGFAGLFLKKNLVHGWNAKRNWKDDAATTANAYLGGMVANGAGMGGYEPWEGLVVGIIGGIVYCVLCFIFEKIKLDDALEAFQLHGGCGTTGVIAAAFFNHHNGIYHGGPGKTLGYQILCWLVISSWSFVWSFIIYFILNKMGWLRVDLKTEIVGYDFIDSCDHLKFSGKLKRISAIQKPREIEMAH